MYRVKSIQSQVLNHQSVVLAVFGGHDVEPLLLAKTVGGSFCLWTETK